MSRLLVAVVPPPFPPSWLLLDLADFCSDVILHHRRLSTFDDEGTIRVTGTDQLAEGIFDADSKGEKGNQNIVTMKGGSGETDDKHGPAKQCGWRSGSAC